MGRHLNPQICLNGHVIVDDIKDHVLTKKFCPICAESTITKCTKCDAPIKGPYVVEGGGYSGYSPQAFCDNCGNAYPWTDRWKIAANELINFSDTLNTDEKNQLSTAINDLLKDSPNSRLAELKFKKYTEKVSKEIVNSLKDILKNLVNKNL